MSNNSYRVRTTVNGDDNVIRVNLKQGVKTLNILSLEINPEDAYEVHTSNYGVIVGRVLANGSFGVPNVKVSVFVPISDEDENDYVISNEYPFKTPQSKDINGVKYNLVNSENGGPGTFPSKKMVLDNNGCVEVFDKYWKYTAVTNNSGDYMIFGVPTGTTQVHCDCDLSDIGILSQHPYDFIAKGYNANLFKSKTEFTDTNLSTAVHIISQDSTVYVYPFWGDKNANKIGITRKDIEINYEFTPSCVFMGSSITDSKGSYIGIDGQPNGTNGRFDTLSTSVGNIEVIRQTLDGSIEELKDNVVGIIDGNGVWCYQIPMNLDRIGTDEYGNFIKVNDPNKGIPTRARVRFRISLTDTSESLASEYTAKMLVPCNPKLEYSDSSNEPTIEPYSEDWMDIYEFGSKTPDSSFRDLYWGKVYSVKQYYPRFQYEYNPKNIKYEDDNDEDDMLLYDYAGYPPQFAFKQSCISSIDQISGLNTFPYTTMYSALEEHIDYRVSDWFYYHLTDEGGDGKLTSKGLHFCFENDWINGCLYFPKVIIKRNLSGQYDYFGSLNDGHAFAHEGFQYDYTTISGRHHWFYDNGFKLKNPIVLYYTTQNVLPIMTSREDARFFLQDNASIFTRSNLKTGILTKMTTSLNETVFYYRCGGLQLETPREGDTQSSEVVYRRLYSTDIIVLGNIDDIYDSLPRLYESLPSTSALFPPIAPPKEMSESGMNMHAYQEQIKKAVEDEDSELTDMFGNIPDTIQTSSHVGYKGKYSKELYDITNSINQTIGNNKYQLMSMLMKRSSLFFGLKVWHVDDFLAYDSSCFVNSSRLCELDVHNDSVFNLGNEFIPTNGLIDRLDISTNENRSAFATMNYDINRSYTNEVGYKQYAVMPLSIVGFEGRLQDYIRVNNYVWDSPVHGKTNLAVDYPDNSYICFRFGKVERYEDTWRGPFIQGKKAFPQDRPELEYGNGDLLLPENSFYFYFGLRSGYSAIDLLNERFIGTREKDAGVKYGATATQDLTYISCNADVELGSVVITTYGLSAPWTYRLYLKNRHELDGQSLTSDLRINDLSVGFYRVYIEDSLGKTVETYFSIINKGITINSSSYVDESSNDSILILTKLNSENIRSVYFDYSNNSISVSGESASNCATIDFGNSVHIDTVDFQPTKPLIITFPNNTQSVDATITHNIFGCIKSYQTFTFIKIPAARLLLNNVPVEYVKNWDMYRSTFPKYAPDDIFNQYEFNVWNSVMTPFVSDSRCCFKFTDDNGDAVTTYQNQLKAVSDMCKCVFSNALMSLTNNSSNNTYTELVIYPYYGLTSQFMSPEIYWNQSISPSVTGVQQLSIGGAVAGNIDIPHIVGSNFPKGFNAKTLLLNGGGNGYVNNAVIKCDSVASDSNGIFGIHLFGAKHSTYPSLDKPYELMVNNTTNINTNSSAVGSYNLGGINNFYGIRTVDKRLDYQFSAKTPLILPSGYEKFPSLIKKPFISGEMEFDLYGGIRLDYNTDNMLLTSYSATTEGLITGGPTSDAQLYSSIAYGDNDSSSPIDISSIENRDNIWYSTRTDIDHVSYSFDNLNGIDSMYLSFTDCSSDFSNGFVSPGTTESVKMSYKSGINIIRRPEDYDISYSVGIDAQSGFTDCYASFEGSRMTIQLAKDEYWNEVTYTDTYLEGNHNAGTYPDWATLSDGDVLPEYKKELTIYACQPTSSNSFDVIDEYGLHFQTIASDLPNNPEYDENTLICPYYYDGVSNHPLSDEECLDCLRFEIDYLDDVKMQTILPENAFIMIPTRKVYASPSNNTLLKQGVVYKSGYVYFAGSIRAKIDKINRKATIWLNTPLRVNNNIDYQNTTSLSSDNSGIWSWHTIGEVDNYYCDNADLKYISSNAEFQLRVIDSNNIATMYFTIKNGLKYKITVDFRNSE